MRAQREIGVAPVRQPAAVAEHVLGGNQVRLGVVPDVGGKVAGKRHVQRKMPGIDQLQHYEGEDGLAERRGVENRVFVDGAFRASQPNAVVQMAIELAIADDRHRDAGDAARGHEAAERHAVFDVHAVVWQPAIPHSRSAGVPLARSG